MYKLFVEYLTDTNINSVTVLMSIVKESHPSLPCILFILIFRPTILVFSDQNLVIINFEKTGT